MIRHFLKLAWRRKRGNALLIVEVFASFLVVFAVATATIQLARSYRAPLGFDYENVWTIPGLPTRRPGSRACCAKAPTSKASSRSPAR